MITSIVKAPFMKAIFLLIFIVITSKSFAQFSQVDVQRYDYSPWSSTFFSLYSNELGATEKGGGRSILYSYPSVNYRIDSDRRLSLRLPFLYETAGFDQYNGNEFQDSKISLQDPFLSFNNYSVALLPLDIGLNWEGRIYLPLSENSKRQDTITHFQNIAIFSKYMSTSFVLEYQNRADYYVQSRTNYRNEFAGAGGFPVSTISLTKKAELNHWVQLWYVIQKRFGVSALVGYENTWYNKSIVENKAGQQSIT